VLQEEKQELQRELNLANQEIEIMEASKRRMAKDVEEARLEYLKYKQKAEQLDKELATTQELLESRSEKLEDIKKDRSNLEQAVHTLRNQLRKNDAEMGEFQASIKGQVTKQQESPVTEMQVVCFEITG
jgi:chromosome segregation ATPase